MVGMIENRLMEMRKVQIFIAAAIALLVSTSCSSTKVVTSTSNLEEVLETLRFPDQKTVLISAHRGDWRNAPENSLRGLANCINMGIDIVECDLKITKDRHLIILHDNTLDRTTTGKGKPEDFTLAELRQLRLKDGAGHPTRHTIPTFDEFLEASKNKIVICIDKGFAYFEQAMYSIHELGMSNQIIYNIPAMSPDSLRSLNLSGMDDNIMLNLLNFPNDTIKAQKLVKAYSLRKNIIMHPTFVSDTLPLVKWMPVVKKSGMHLWLNSLWPEHNGGHDDSRAVELGQPEESWGWLIEHGATIIQTDRPAELIKYLTLKGLRPKAKR